VTATSDPTGAGATLVAFEQRLRAVGAPVAQVLAPGIPEERVREVLEPLGMDPPQELVAWYAWHDGLTTPTPHWPGEALLMAWHPYSLEQALAEYHSRDRGEETWQWQPTWWPLAKDGGPQRVAVHCTPPQGVHATVRVVEPAAGLFAADDVPPVTGLAQVVTWWTEAIDTGAYTFVPEAGAWDIPDRNLIPPERRRTFLL
jgi:hypothetical protein